AGKARGRALLQADPTRAAKARASTAVSIAPAGTAHTIPRLPQRSYMSLSPAAPVPRGETELAIPAMCNRIRGLKEWSAIPRSLTRPLINFEYNPNVAPTEQVPAFLAERGKPLATRMPRFAITLPSRACTQLP